MGWEPIWDSNGWQGLIPASRQKIYAIPDGGICNKEQMRAAIAQVVNTLCSALGWKPFGGEATSTRASDSKKFHAVDQNLLTQWHARYRGPGVLVYWHVECRSVCIYSQVKSCTLLRSGGNARRRPAPLYRHDHQTSNDRFHMDKARSGLLLATYLDFVCFLVSSLFTPSD